MRDSLVRLAQSAMQRHYAGDANSTNRNSGDELEVCKDETISHNRYVTKCILINEELGRFYLTADELMITRS